MRKKWTHFQQKVRFFLYRTTLTDETKKNWFSSFYSDYTHDELSKIFHINYNQSSTYSVKLQALLINFVPDHN